MKKTDKPENSPENAEAPLQDIMGQAWQAVKNSDWPLAEKKARQWIEQRPEDEKAVEIMAAAAANQRNFDEAASFYERLHALDPMRETILLALHRVYRQKADQVIEGQNPETMDLWATRILTIFPHSSAGLNVKGISSRLQGDFKAAASFHQQGLQAQDLASQDEAMHQAGLGMVALETEDYEAAFHAFTRAVELAPDISTYRHNLVVVLYNMGKDDAASELLYQLIAEEPENPDYLYSRAQIRLRAGDWPKGWADYEARWNSFYMKRDVGKGLRGYYTRFFPAIPVCTRQFLSDQSLHGKSLIIYGEQGYGDNLMALRLLPLVKEKTGASPVLVTPYGPLVPLMRAIPDLERSTKIVQAVEGMAVEKLPKGDGHCGILSLFHLLSINSPADMPLISKPIFSAEHQKIWRDRISSSRSREKNLAIGVAFEGNAKAKNRQSRSLDLSRLCAALPDDCTIHLLQKDKTPEIEKVLQNHPSIFFWGDVMDDFTDTAQLIHELDFIVTIDTAIAHLAGLLQKPGCLLLPTPGEWRWGPPLLQENRGYCRLYPHLYELRQKTPGAWDSVLDQLSDLLQTI